MMNSVITFSLPLATVSAGLMAGVYFAFSGFIMRSLDQLPAPQGAAAMNAINEVILRSGFMPLFFGSSLLYLVLGGAALLDGGMPGRWIVLGASLVYLAGMLGSTVFVNVPLNDELARSAGDDPAVTETWGRYLRQWTRWNHVRTLSSLAAMSLGLMHLAQYP